MKPRKNMSPLHGLVMADGRKAVEVAVSHISLQAFRYRLKHGWPVDAAASVRAMPGRFSSLKAR